MSLLLWLGVPLLDHLFRWVFRSSRVETRGWERVERFRALGRPVLFSYWHRWAIHHLFHFSGGRHTTMSGRKDSGELGDRILVRHGYVTVRGSSGILSTRGWKDRGGRDALQEMVRIIRESGFDGGLTVDGPHGPPLQVKRGILLLAMETGAPLIPMAVASRPRLVLPTWDRMHVPLPFSRIVYLFGEPIEVRSAGETALDTCLQTIQDRMIELTREAETWFGKK